MNIIVRLIQVIHWFVLLITLITILATWGAMPTETNWSTSEWMIENISEYMIFYDDEFFPILAGVSIDLIILMPFIRYIIFGRFGWFPWTPFRKE
jgi:hypothetical protein